MDLGGSVPSARLFPLLPQADRARRAKPEKGSGGTRRPRLISIAEALGKNLYGFFSRLRRFQAETHIHRFFDGYAFHLSPAVCTVKFDRIQHKYHISLLFIFLGLLMLSVSVPKRTGSYQQTLDTHPVALTPESFCLSEQM